MSAACAGGLTFAGQAAPARLPGQQRYAAVSAGGLHTCALTVDGTVHCWGLNDQGQLGSATTTKCSEPASGGGDTPYDFGELFRRKSSPCSGVPLPVDIELEFATVTAGASHSCALTVDGAAYCWGSNEHGQLGTGESQNTHVPTHVLGEHSFTLISAGGFHTCAITYDGTLYCWGANTSGQLGTNTSGDAMSPVRVSSDQPFVQISAGRTHSCGITEAGDAWCWGSNEAGEAGPRTGESCRWRRAPSPRETKLDGPAGECVRTPQRIPLDSPLVRLSTGTNLSCGVDRMLRTWCWGTGEPGWLNQLRVVDWKVCVEGPDCFRSPRQVAPSLELRILALRGPELCGITVENRLHCLTFTSITEGASSPELLRPDISYTALSTGSGHACALNDAGQLYCWGAGRYGQLGDGHVAEAASMVQPRVCTSTEWTHGMPQRSPDGRWVLSSLSIERAQRTGRSAPRDAHSSTIELFVIPTGGGERRVVAHGSDRGWHPVGYSARWSPDGLWIAFEAERRSSDEVDVRDLGDIWIVRPDGSELTQLTDHPSADARPRWSPDGTHILFSRFDANLDQRSLMTIGVDGTGLRTVVADGAYTNASWSPDGNWILLTGTESMSLLHPDGSNRHELVDGSLITWTPNGSAVLYYDDDGDVRFIRADGSGTRRIVERGVNRASQSWFSTNRRQLWNPDGSLVALVLHGTSCDEDGRSGLVVLDSIGSMVSDLREPRCLARYSTRVTWSHDGDSLFYETNGGSKFAAAVDGTGRRLVVRDSSDMRCQ